MQFATTASRLGPKQHHEERGLELMGEHEQVTSTPEDRWRRAAAIFAAGAIRAALEAEAAASHDGGAIRRLGDTPAKVLRELREAA